MANILVTGANGFIGTHIVDRLKKKNKVISLVHNPLVGRWEEEALKGTVKVNCDIRNLNDVRMTMARYQIQEVYRTAAISIVKTAFRDPLSVYDVNVMGLVSVLEAARTLGVPKVLVLNTDKVYGEGLNATEGWAYKASEPYATSKACQGLIVQSFIETYGMNIMMSHSCNVFGYHPHSNRIVPNVIKACLKGKQPLVFTNDNSVREYIFIDDVVSAFERLMSEEGHRGARNISTGWILNQKEVVLKILEHFKGIEPKYAEGELPSQIQKQSLKSVRWDWKPGWTLDEAIGKTIDLFKKYEADWS